MTPINDNITSKSSMPSGNYTGGHISSTWSTLPKRMLQQLRNGDSSVRVNNKSYNIENGALSIRRKNFPQLEVTIGSKTLDRSRSGKDVNSVVLEPLGKSDYLDLSNCATLLMIIYNHRSLNLLVIWSRYYPSNFQVHKVKNLVGDGKDIMSI